MIIRKHAPVKQAKKIEVVEKEEIILEEEETEEVAFEDEIEFDLD